MLEAQARLTQEETKAEAINVYEPYIKLLEEEIGDLIGLAATHRWFSPRVEEGKKCRERIKAFKGGTMRERPRVFRSMGAFRRFYFPKAYERERLATMSPSERAKHDANESLQKIRGEL